MDEKVIIVEGGSDRKRLARVLAEPVRNHLYEWDD